VFNFYPAMSAEAAAKSQDIGIGSHTDLQCFTLLWQDMNGGLQVLSNEGEWIKATPLEGTFVVNIGDYLMRLTNDRMKSTVHRVYNRSTVDRYTIPSRFLGLVCVCVRLANIHQVFHAVLFRLQFQRDMRSPAELCGPGPSGQIRTDLVWRLVSTQVSADRCGQKGIRVLKGWNSWPRTGSREEGSIAVPARAALQGIGLPLSGICKPCSWGSAVVYTGDRTQFIYSFEAQSGALLFCSPTSSATKNRLTRL
jgi:hypothetical protein